MKMLRKINDGKILEISQENVYEGVSFSKVTNLLCSDCNFAIKIARHRYFWNMYWRLAVLTNNILRKASTVNLQPCSTQSSIL